MSVVAASPPHTDGETRTEEEEEEEERKKRKEVCDRQLPEIKLHKRKRT